MSKEKISGSEALMRSLEHEGVKTLSAIREGLSCRYLMRCMTIATD